MSMGVVMLSTQENPLYAVVCDNGASKESNKFFYGPALELFFCAEDVGDAFACGIRQTQRDLQRLSKEGRLIAFGGKKNRRYSKPKKAA